MAYTKKEMLQEIDNAIYAVAVGGQSYKIGSRSLTRANLTELRNMRAELACEIASEQSDSLLLDGTVVAFFDGR